MKSVAWTYYVVPGQPAVHRLRRGERVPKGSHWWVVYKGNLVATNHRSWRGAVGHPISSEQIRKLARFR